MMALGTKHAPALDLPARFMALGMTLFTVAILSSPWTLPLMQGQINAFSLLALVHLMTLGFIGSIIIGASYQLIPVALQAPLLSVRLGRASFWFYAAGLMLFLTGLMRQWLPGLSMGGTLLGVAFAIYLVVVAGTFRRAPHRDAVAWHILIGALFSGVGMSLGVMLAFNKSSGFLAGRLLDVLAAHILVMLVGWVGITYIGVACRLVGMFTLAEKHLLPSLAWTGLVLTTGGTSLFALRFILRWDVEYAQAASAMLLAGFLVFGVQLARMYRRRMRRAFDIHAPFAVAATILMILAAASLVMGLLVGTTPADPLWMATGWIAIFGVIAVAIQGFFYKISTFLVWLQRYAPVAGKLSVPKLDEMYSRRVGLAGLGVWLIGIGFGWAALMLDRPWLPIAGVLLVSGGLCFVFNVVNIARHAFPGTGGSGRLPVHGGPAAMARER
jgi:hypothetical protein